MRIGLSLEDFTVPGGPANLRSTIGRIARDADEANLASFWVMDHFFQIPFIGEPEREMLEGYSVLSYVAGLTSRIELGTLVTGVAYRHPGVLIKTVTTLDLLSGGRAWLGIGAAWNEMEARSLGIPFPPLGERFDQLEETLRIAHQMWAGDERPFAGDQFQLDRPINSPASLRRPHPPILIGGGGERRTLRLVAQYADACNLFAFDPSAVTRKLDVLRRHCEELGRPYEEIEKTAMLRMNLSRGGTGGSVSPRTALDQVLALGEIGIDHLIVSLVGVHEPGNVELLGEVATMAGDLVPAGRASGSTRG
jgi:F420-dependent oxidoreductase-like protein